MFVTLPIIDCPAIVEEEYIRYTTVVQVGKNTQ